MSREDDLAKRPASCMTLREFYAGVAMLGILASWPEGEPPPCGATARDSVCYADALIAELAKHE